MCNAQCLRFVARALAPEEIRGRSVLEVGSKIVNGSVKPMVQAHAPQSYLGVDIDRGPGVDEICDVNNLVGRYGTGTFDMVLCTELLEHVRDWRRAVSNLKGVLKPGGILLITTRSKGFPYHGYPADYWRFETHDLHALFSDFVIERLETDPSSPGVFLKAVKPGRFLSRALDDHRLYSVIRRRRCLSVGAREAAWVGKFFVMREALLRALPAVRCPARIRKTFRRSAS
jgi:SAM-dependent methyltransferase